MHGAEMAATGNSRRRLAQADGFTLIELLLAASISLVVLGVGVGLMTTALQSQPKVAERASEIQQARVAMERLTREIRQGDSVVSASDTQFSLITQVNSATCGGATSDEARLCRITYTCSVGSCTRVEANPDGSGAAAPQIVVNGITTSSVFSYTPTAAAPTYIGVKLLFPSENGDDSVTLTDGVTMRNATLPAS
jgi:prepilin-type N-terminal cleavage/methylation domain-containing protein